jgi:hypothetical protein
MIYPQVDISDDAVDVLEAVQDRYELGFGLDLKTIKAIREVLDALDDARPSVEGHRV